MNVRELAIFHDPDDDQWYWQIQFYGEYQDYVSANNGPYTSAAAAAEEACTWLKKNL